MAEYLSISIGGGSNSSISNNDVVLTTHDTAEVFHIGNNLTRSDPFPGDPYGGYGVAFSNGYVGFGCLPKARTKLSLAHNFSSYYTDGTQAVEASNSSLTVYDAHGNPGIAMNAATGALRCASGVFNTLRSPNPATTNTFSISRVTDIEFSNDGTCSLSVVNAPPLQPGDRVLMMDVATMVVLYAEYHSGGNASLLLFPIDCDREYVLKNISQSFSQTLFKIGDFASRLIDRHVVRYVMNDVHISYAGPVITVQGTTSSPYEISSLVDLTDTYTVGIDAYDDNISPVLVNVTSVTIGAGGIVTLNGDLRDANFVGLPATISRAYVIANVDYLVDRSSDVFQVFDVSPSFAVDASNYYHLLLQLPASYGEGAVRIIRDSRLLYLNNQTLHVTLATSEGSSMEFVIDNSSELYGLDRLGVGTRMTLGVLGEYAGMPLIVSETYVSTDDMLRVWTVDTLPTLAALVAQFEGLNVLVRDGTLTYVGYVDYATANSMIIRTHQDDLNIVSGTRSVFVFPLALRSAVSFVDPVNVSNNLNAGGHVTVSGNLRMSEFMVWGNPAQTRPSMTWGYSNSSVFSVGDNTLQFTNIAEGFSNAVMQVKTRGGMIVGSNAGLEALAPLHVYETWGTATLRSSNVSGYSIRTEGGIVCMGGVHVPSDERYKKNIETLQCDAATRALLNLRVCSYVNSVGNREIGVMAQDAAKNVLTRCAVATAEKADRITIPVHLRCTNDACDSRGCRCRDFVLSEAATSTSTSTIVQHDILVLHTDAGGAMTVECVAGFSDGTWHVRLLHTDADMQLMPHMRGVVHSVTRDMLVLRHDAINALVVSAVQHLYNRTRCLKRELRTLRHAHSSILRGMHKASKTKTRLCSRSALRCCKRSRTSS